MTARFATLADAATFQGNLTSWRQANPTLYNAEALKGMTLAQVQYRIQNAGYRVVIDFDSTNAVRGIVIGSMVVYIDGLPGARLEEVLLNPAILPASRVAALGALFNDLIALLKPRGVTRLVGEEFDDSSGLAALNTLFTQGTLPKTNVIDQFQRPKPGGATGTYDYLSMVI